MPQPTDVRDESGHLIRELHGITLAQILEYLVARYGWPGLDARIRVNCFAVDPSIKSSLTFLRRTPWARTKVEDLYVETRTAEVLAQRKG
ncbi:VF530 family protein [Hymenobacter sp. BT635]|uniref:VF530 family protein n=1 Tax=Hymenobacter nitidus TaxID=2880929 RepID=A0ABS8AE96_9BACT|nr:VF530 family protein [Hymenobacter nitidus]MCB2378601.1 VF530 family protein [Hymenobacter nitidus]